MPPRGHAHFRIKLENPFSIFSRLMKYILKINNWKIFVVAGLIIVSSITQVAGMSMIKELIDVTIPALLNDSSDFMPLYTILLKMGSLFLLSIAAMYLYNLLICYIFHFLRIL